MGGDSHLSDTTFSSNHALAHIIAVVLALLRPNILIISPNITTCMTYALKDIGDLSS